MRSSTLDERDAFYRNEFDVDSLSRWIVGKRHSTKFAMILGRHTGVVLPSKSALKDDVIVIDEWKSARDIRNYALDYLPESLYYDRNRYLDVRDCSGCEDKRRSCPRCHNYDGQQLAFDLDPENVDCPYHGHIGDKIQAGRGLAFCMLEFKAVRGEAAALAEELKQKYEKVSVVYSGRGFHVVVDDEDAYCLLPSERRTVARRYGKAYAIDEWVTGGGSRLMRLPLSLNALVSRKCAIMKGERDLLEFDPRDSALVIPDFLRSA